MFRTRFELKGHVRLRQTRNGRTILVRQGQNLVVQAGKDLVAQTLETSPGPTRPSHMALGSGATVVTDADTALGTELGSPGRDAVVIVRTDNEIKYTSQFTNSSGGDITVNEIGIFNAAAVGTMLARFLTQGFSMANGDILDVDWTLTVG